MCGKVRRMEQYEDVVVVVKNPESAVEGGEMGGTSPGQSGEDVQV